MTDLFDVSKLTLKHRRIIARTFAQELVAMGENWLDQIDDTSAVAEEYIEDNLQSDLDCFPGIIREAITRTLTIEGVKV